MSNSLDSLRQMLTQGAFDTVLAKLESDLKQSPDDWQLWQIKAEAHQILKNTPEAIAAFEQALCLEPGTAEIHAQLGRLFLQAAWFEEAQKHIEAARAFDPQSLAHTLILIECFLLQGQRQSALIYLKEALQLNPESPQAFALLAQTLFLYGRWPEARDALRQALFFDPTYEAACIELLELALRMNDLAEAQRCFVQDFQTRPSSKAPGLYLQACLFLQQGDISQAREFFEYSLNLEVDPIVLLQLSLSSPWVCQSSEERLKWQQLVHQGLRILTEDLQTTVLPRAPLLAYHPEVQDELYQTLGQWIRPEQPAIDRQRSTEQANLQIGLICSDLNQVASHDWLLGLLQHQSHTQIQWQILYLHPGDLPAEFEAWASQCLQVPDHPLALKQLVQDLKLDGLIYLDLNNSLSQLVRSQLVNWQACAPILDVFSGLKGIKTLSKEYLWAVPRPVSSASRSRWNLPRMGHLYLCSAPPQYWLPEWDPYLLALLNRDRKAFVIGRTEPGSLLHVQVKQRHESSLGDRQHRVKWVESSDNQIPELIALSDMLIEPWEFSTPWSGFQALAQGKPAIACPGKSFASQLSQIYWQRMDLNELLLADLSQLASMSDYLIERPKKAYIKEKLNQGQQKLINISAFVSGFENHVYQEVIKSRHV